jgi:hypothetical protein
MLMFFQQLSHQCHVLSTAFPSMSHAILRENGTITGAGGGTLIDVEVSSNKLATSVNLLKSNSLVKVKTGLTVALPDSHQAAVTLQVSTDGVSYSEIDSKYLNGTPNQNMQGIFILGPDSDSTNNTGSSAFEILVDPSAVGDNNAFHVKVSIRADSGETIYINRGNAASNSQKGAGVSYITLEEVFNNGSQTITSLD